MARQNDLRRRVVREMQRDLKNMESIHWLAQWLNARDSNSGNAASLTDAIEVLISRAIELHKKELANWDEEPGETSGKRVREKVRRDDEH